MQPIKITTANRNQNMWVVFLICLNIRPNPRISKCLPNLFTPNLFIHPISLCCFVYTYIFVYRKIWCVQWRGVGSPTILHYTSPYRLSHILISLYHYILISVFYTTLYSPLVTLDFFIHPILLHTHSFYTRSFYLILLSSRNFFTPIPPNSDNRINAIT
jgi:hypothetical protein